MRTSGGMRMRDFVNPHLLSDPQWRAAKEQELAAEVLRLRERIAELEAAQQWIPVSERLPEREGLYLWAIVGRAPIIDYYIGHLAGPGRQYITHWMPLPQRPGGENETV